VVISNQVKALCPDGEKTMLDYQKTLFVAEPSGITGLSKETCISTGKQQWGWATRKTVVQN
jgi:hypothetical protein